MMLYRQMMRELSRLLDVEGNKKVVESRQSRISTAPDEYIRLLFDDAGIETLLVDSGYPFKDSVGYEIDLDEFSEMVGREVREILRLEVVIHGLLKGLVPYVDAVEDFRSQIREAVGGGVVSLKSIIAYRTGLGVRTWNEPVVRRSWGEMGEMIRAGRNPSEVLSERNERNKSVYDSFLMIGLEEAASLNVPVQLHTGMGDSPSMDLRIANPALLYDLLQTPTGRGTRLVLTHGGYPYLEEAGFLVNAYPNVHLDLSETIPFISVGLRNRLLSLIEMAPTTKIMYGSDGFNIPEINWLAAVQSKKALGSVFSDLVERGDLGEEDALDAAEGFLSGNARRFYRL